MTKGLIREVYIYAANRLGGIPGMTVNHQRIGQMDNNGRMERPQAPLWPAQFDVKRFVMELLSFDGVPLDVSMSKEGHKLVFRLPALPHTRWSINGHYNYQSQTYNREGCTIHWFSNSGRTKVSIAPGHTPEQIRDRLARAIKSYRKKVTAGEALRQKALIESQESLARIARGERVQNYTGKPIAPTPPRVPAAW